MRKIPRRTTSLHTRNVPTDLKAQFKAYCAKRGYTMELAIIALLRRTINNNTCLPEARKPPKR